MSIAEIIEQQIGLRSEEDFTQYYKRKLETGASQEDVDLLDPDRIDNSEFWQYLDKHFQRGICGAIQDDYSEQNVNNTNRRLAHQCGITGYLSAFLMLNTKLKILEIGPGYGSIYYLIEKEPQIEYYACDVVPRFCRVTLSDGNSIPRELCYTPDYHMIICCNVMQHMSVKQRQNHYTQSAGLLKPGGIFLFTNLRSVGYYPHIKMLDRSYICHYGQYTPIQTYDEIQNDITRQTLNCLDLLQVNSRHDGLTTWIYRKR